MWWFLQKNKKQKQVEALYHAIVRQARQAIFYERYGVKDNEDGRFDMLALHLSLVLIALRTLSNHKGKGIALQLTEKFISDMDDNLREMGAGDLGVARRVKFMAGALNGRLLAYQEALQGEITGKLREVLIKNLYRGADIEPSPHLINYVNNTLESLKTLPLDRLLKGNLDFPDLFQG